DGIDRMLAEPVIGMIVTASEAPGGVVPKPRPVMETNRSLVPAGKVATAGLLGRFVVAARAGQAASSARARNPVRAGRRVNRAAIIGAPPGVVMGAGRLRPVAYAASDATVKDKPVSLLGMDVIHP